MITASLVPASSLPYEIAFGAVAVACFAATARARGVEDPELRTGLVALLLASGGWAASHVGLFALPRPLAEVSYLGGLVLGFGTVWAWLYFCSAYTGRSYHREPAFRWLAAGVFLAVVTVKLTNPLHHLYFETTFVTEPFAHLAIEQRDFHWAVTGFSYALAAAGIFMLLDRFVQSDYDTRPLAVLVLLTGLPVALDVIGYATPLFVDIIYAPLGVGVFAVGVLFLFEDRFFAVRATGDVNDPLVFLDDDDRIRDYNDQAGELFPALATGDPLESAVPGALEAAAGDEVFELDTEGGRRYFVVSNSAFGLGEDRIGEVVLFSDVTRGETQRRELARHNRQLEDFAGAMTHELRNSLQVVDWNVRAAAESINGGLRGDPLEAATGATGRLSDIVDDFTTLARHGQTVERVETVDLRATAETAWSEADVHGLSLTVTDDAAVAAEPRRLRALLVSAFEFARHNGASTVRIDPLADGFAVVNDGDPPIDPVEKYFAYDEAVPNASAGMKLPNVRSLARVHDWSVGIDADYDDGVRVVVSGVRVLEGGERDLDSPDGSR